MRTKLFFLLLMLFSLIGATSSHGVECDVSEKQLLSIHSLLCGDPTNWKQGCFERYSKGRAYRIADDHFVLRACGYAKLAEQLDQVEYGMIEIKKPIAECFGQAADQSAIFSKALEEAQKNKDKTCGPERMARTKILLKERSAYVEAMKNPQKVRDRLYGILGIRP